MVAATAMLMFSIQVKKIKIKFSYTSRKISSSSIQFKGQHLHNKAI